MKLVLHDEQATQALAEKLADLASTQLVVYLFGDLGSGKTSFVRHFLRALGHEGLVKSPTYTLVEPYELQHRCVFHYDLYRLASPQELEFIGIRDYVASPALHFVEWPEKGEGFLPEADVEMHLNVLPMGEREVTLLAKTELGETLVEALG